ncbi:MAG TPA: sigma 54-interacting transcriptional regulator [Acidobacteriaceae bacterium]|nr:sigma 54-interacting transcriptional regulator [Acidobacteriaceae bacterium]
MAGHIVLVAPSAESSAGLVERLAREGYCTLSYRSVEEGLAFLRSPGCPADVAAFHVTMRRQSDQAALAELATLRPELQIFFVRAADGAAPVGQGHGDGLNVLSTALDHPQTAQTLCRALEAAARASEAAGERDAAAAALPYSEAFLRRVGMADVPVLLHGETGVGKEVMARRLRSYSRRAEAPFLKINCAALPAELAESELFGSAKGAFTGATADRPGRFETAQGGTILLDEIGDMDLRLQTKLLHVLQDGEIQPLGSNRTIKVNVRVMAATHRDLTRAIREGSFREDLYYRLNVIGLVIPPLRERVEQIVPLAETLLERHLPPGQQRPAMSEELKRFLMAYRWPGNVRELENVMRRFLVYQDSKLLMEEMQAAERENRPTLHNVAKFPAGGDGVGQDGKGPRVEAHGARGESLDPLSEAARIAETELILEALEAARWNRRQAAAALQIDYKAFLYKMQKYGIVAAKRKQGGMSA